MPGRPVVLARELTKKFEECLRGTPAELRAVFQQRAVKGEFVVLVGADAVGGDPGKQGKTGEADGDEAGQEAIPARISPKRI
jgi:16S rRNA C1402 (ribose-2'-O) methylase RsmI